MSNSLKLTGLFFGFLLICVGSYFVMTTNAESHASKLRISYETLVRAQGVKHDEIWKTLKGIAQVDKQSDAMQLKYYQAWENAVSKTSNLHEAAESVFPMMFQQAGVNGPNNEIKIKLAQTIDDKNAEFTASRNNVLAACNELNEYVQDPWNIYFLPVELTRPVDCKIITSSRTNKALESGVDDDNSIY